MELTDETDEIRRGGKAKGFSFKQKIQYFIRDKKGKKKEKREVRATQTFMQTHL